MSAHFHACANAVHARGGSLLVFCSFLCTVRLTGNFILPVQGWSATVLCANLTWRLHQTGKGTIHVCLQGVAQGAGLEGGARGRGPRKGLVSDVGVQ